MARRIASRSRADAITCPSRPVRRAVARPRVAWPAAAVNHRPHECGASSGPSRAHGRCRALRASRWRRCNRPLIHAAAAEYHRHHRADAYQDSRFVMQWCGPVLFSGVQGLGAGCLSHRRVAGTTKVAGAWSHPCVAVVARSGPGCRPHQRAHQRGPATWRTRQSAFVPVTAMRMPKMRCAASYELEKL